MDQIESVIFTIILFISIIQNLPQRRVLQNKLNVILFVILKRGVSIINLPHTILKKLSIWRCFV